MYTQAKDKKKRKSALGKDKRWMKEDGLGSATNI